ncbi:uncharacterized protein LOC118202412 isoform X2 [Stegodyphus dumicola]|uniref:uncharacterized protein LOC118202412 isoform X2 n=1 Tax=Stegodyphus dumicola TaxID=202533 RepID=UPI0015A90C6F|nr:uncharacterized protein LOC118202412 isoform X2 [Stegodyphus dumicola]
MSQFEAYRGIFIQSKESNEEFIKACIRELQPVCNSPIKRVVPYGGNGIQMYFKNERTVVTVLRRRVLLVSGKRCEMCPLVTHLTIHKVIPNNEHDVQKKLSDKLQLYVGPVLKINELPISKEYPSIGSGNWRVVIDIPELEALKVFQNLKKKMLKNSSNETSIQFFYAEDGMKLSFFCRKCEKDGHISQRCKMLLKRKNKPSVNKPSGNNIRSNTCFQKGAAASASTASNNPIREQTSREATGQPKRETFSTSMRKPSVDDYCRKLLLLKTKVLQDTLRAPSFGQSVTTPPTKNILSPVTVKSESQSENVQNTLRAPSFYQRVTTPPARSIPSSVNVKSESQSEVVQNTLRAPSFYQRVTTPPARSIPSSVNVKNSKVVPDSLRAHFPSQPVTTSPMKNILSSATVKSESQSKDAQNTLRAPSFSQRLTKPLARNTYSFVNVKKSEDVQNTSGAPALNQPVITPPTRNIHSSVTDKSESRNPRRNSVTREIKILPNSRTEECIQKAGGACRLSQPQLEIFF